MLTEEAVERALLSLFIAAEGTKLRREEQKKVVELLAILREIDKHGKNVLLVDAAAGKAYVGLVAASLLGFRRVHVIERDAARIEACKAAAARLGGAVELSVVAGDVGDRASFPASPDVVVALHACGAASDAIIDAAIATNARWLYLVPCCYASSVPFSRVAEAKADALGIPRQAEVRRRFVMSLVDAERTLRLEAGGYEVTTVAFVPPTVTPHNLLFRARRAREPGRMKKAEAMRARLSSQ